MQYLSSLLGLLNSIFFRVIFYKKLRFDGYNHVFCSSVNFGKYGFASIGSKFRSRPNCVLNITSGNLVVGRNVFFNRGVQINCHERVFIGDNCLFGHNVLVFDHNHRFRDKGINIREQGYKVAPVHIADNVWIGANCVILPGVTIGSNVVIGAGSIISSDIPTNAIVKSSRDLDITIY